MKLPKIITQLTTSIGSLSPIFVAAQSIPVPVEGESLTLSKVVLLVQDVVDTLFILVSIIVVGVMVYAGLKMVWSRGDPKKFDEAKLILRQAVFGAIVIFGVGIIINTIADFATNPTQILR